MRASLPAHRPLIYVPAAASAARRRAGYGRCKWSMQERCALPRSVVGLPRPAAAVTCCCGASHGMRLVRPILKALHASTRAAQVLQHCGGR